MILRKALLRSEMLEFQIVALRIYTQREAGANNETKNNQLLIHMVCIMNKQDIALAGA